MNEREESEDKDKDSPIKIIRDESNQNKTDSNKLLSPKSGEIENGDSRSGANSPSPSDGMLEDAHLYALSFGFVGFSIALAQCFPHSPSTDC